MYYSKNSYNHYNIIIYYYIYSIPAKKYHTNTAYCIGNLNTFMYTDGDDKNNYYCIIFKFIATLFHQSRWSFVGQVTAFFGHKVCLECSKNHAQVLAAA